MLKTSRCLRDITQYYCSIHYPTAQTTLCAKLVDRHIKRKNITLLLEGVDRADCSFPPPHSFILSDFSL